MDFLALHHLIWVIPLALLAIAAAWWAFAQRRKAVALLTRNATTCHLKTNANPIRRRILAISLLLAVIFALVAVLRPYSGSVITEHRRPAKNLIVLLDISRSMEAVDVDGVSRIEAAKLLLREFVQNRKVDSIGLLSFAGATFPEIPITRDRSMLLKKINTIKPGDIDVGGTDFGDAFKEAEQLLTENPPPGSAIIILSDGDNVTGSMPTRVLAKLKKSNIPVIAIGLGNDSVGASIPDMDLITSANHGNLRTLSDATNGLFIKATPTELDAQVAQLSARVDTIELDGKNIAAELYERPNERYFIPLTLSLLFLMINLFLPLRSGKWHPLTAAVALILTLGFFSPTAEAKAFTTYEEATAEAKKEELPLLLIFTGSDWSKQSIAFEREILTHSVFKKWAEAKVVMRIVDLPRVGLSNSERTDRRLLASRFDVVSYPWAVFIDQDDKRLGSLTHDPDGPGSWTKRANAILAGDKSASDSAATADYLPKEVHNHLDEEGLSDVEKSVRHYNKALEMEKSDPELALNSKDRFQLLKDLYRKAAEFAPHERKDLRFAARHKLALLQHRKGQSMVPKSEQEFQQMVMTERTEPAKLLKRAQNAFKDSLRTYKSAAPLKPGDDELTNNLTLAYQDLARVEAYLEYFKAFQEAIDDTTKALTNESRFIKSQEREVMTRREVNKGGIDDSVSSITRLVQAAEMIEESPTILPEEGLQDYRLAAEDIALAPSPHRERDLETARQHIQDALDHLIDPEQQQPQPQQGQGEGEPQEGEGGGEENEGNQGDDEGEEKGEGRRQNEGQGNDEGDNPQGDKPDEEGDGPNGDEEGNQKGQGGSGDPEADLRRADKEKGDLRDRLLDKLRRQKGKRVPRSKDH